MYEHILQQFFQQRIQLAQTILADTTSSQKTVDKEIPGVSYEASKIYKDHLQEQARRAAKSKRKPKDGI